MSEGDLVFEAGQGGEVTFMSAGGEPLEMGLKGEQVSGADNS